MRILELKPTASCNYITTKSAFCMRCTSLFQYYFGKMTEHILLRFIFSSLIIVKASRELKK